jgi:phosphatidylglycerophosphatase C
MDHAYRLQHPRTDFQANEAVMTAGRPSQYTLGRNAKTAWAAFDFDGTLTRRDTLLPFLRQVMGTPRLIRVLAMESPWLAAYAVGLLPNDQAKVRLLRRTIGGMTKEILDEQAGNFARQVLPRLVRPAMLQRLRQHQKLGHQCVLVTASLTLYIKPWAQKVGFAEVIGSELEFDESGCVTGMLIGGNCYGREKERRLRNILPCDAQLYAYGDSRGDREMLAMADRGWLLSAKNNYGGRLSDI